MTVTPGSRRDARERALELLYEAESKGLDVATVIDGLAIAPDAYATALAVGVADHAIALDHLLGRFARDWPVARMAVMDRTVMRVGALELATAGDIPSGAVLSEAVELAARYGSSDDTSRFVNGILAAVADEVRGGPRAWTPIEVVVFDMDGVIRHWDNADLDELGLAHAAVGDVAFAEDRLTRAMTGGLSLADWSSEIGEVLSPDDPERARAIAAAWTASTWTVDDAMISLIDRVRAAGVRTAVLSNATDRLESQIEEMGVTDRFATVVNSWRVGAAKPDPTVYAAADAAIASTPGDGGAVDPERVLFIDDRVDNVVAALDHGWHAIEMRSADRLAGVFERLGVLGVPDAT